MNTDTWLRFATDQLLSYKISTARLDSLVLLEECLSINRAHILANPELKLTAEQINWLSLCLKRRRDHEPLAYILGRREFYGRDFVVNTNVLIPRSETEPIIDFVKNLPSKNSTQFADIGSGSGCIGITIALELPDVCVDLYDIDPSALRVAKENAEKYKANITINVSDLLKSLLTDYDIIAANLPYVPKDKSDNIDISFEPSIALFSGYDGLDTYRQFWQQLGAIGHKPQYIFTESLPVQHDILKSLALKAGYGLKDTDNFIQKFELNIR